MSAAKANKNANGKTVGVVGLGIMGARLPAICSPPAGGLGYDINAGRRRVCPGRRRDRSSDTKVLAAAADHHHQPAEVRGADRHGDTIAAAKLPRCIVCECSTFTIEDKEKARALRAAGASCSTARSAHRL
jgi:hypothetical protein